MIMLNIPFKQSELSDVECDLIALDRVSGKNLLREPELAGSCWFDYRGMHPTKRTYLFAHYYDAAYRQMIRTHVDYKQVEGPSPRSYFPKDDPLGKTKTQLAKEAKGGPITPFKTMTMTWKARQKADELGIPYDVFCNAGVRGAIGSIWQRMPAPSQLYSEKILDLIIERWASEASESVQAAKSEFYLLRNWIGHPSQEEHATWIVEQIKCRSNPAAALAQFGFVTPMIPPQVMKVSFTASDIQAAHSMSRLFKQN